MRTPIIICENGDVLCFESVRDAERYVEPTDVLNNEYSCFDADGNELKLSVVERKNCFDNDRVKISKSETVANNIAQLRAVIHRFLAESGTHSLDAEQEANLDDLIKLLPRTR